MNKILPYVYRLDNPNTGEFYIGGRFSNKVKSSEDLGTYYFTSSKKIKPNFQNFTITIIAEFFDKHSAYEYEQLLIKEHWRTPGCLNGNYRISGKFIFLPTEKSTEHRRKISMTTIKNYQERPELRLSAAKARKGKTSPNKGKTRQHTTDEIEKIRTAASNRIGSKNPNFRGYFVTPFGKFDSAITAEREIQKTHDIKRDQISRWCLNCNTPFKYKTKKFTEFTIGSTPREHGWWFESVS